MLDTGPILTLIIYVLLTHHAIMSIESYKINCAQFDGAENKNLIRFRNEKL